jgi:hypothetical protein
MSLDRRRLFAALAGAGAASAGNAAGEAQAMPARELGLRAEIDAVSLGIRPNAAEDQTQNLQRAIDQAAAARAVLRLPPGVYRAGGLTLPPYAAIATFPFRNSAGFCTLPKAAPCASPIAKSSTPAVTASHSKRSMAR